MAVSQRRESAFRLANWTSRSGADTCHNQAWPRNYWLNFGHWIFSFSYIELRIRPSLCFVRTWKSPIMSQYLPCILRNPQERFIKACKRSWKCNTDWALYLAWRKPCNMNTFWLVIFSIIVWYQKTRSEIFVLHSLILQQKWSEIRQRQVFAGHSKSHHLGLQCPFIGNFCFQSAQMGSGETTKAEKSLSVFSPLVALYQVNKLNVCMAQRQR